MQIVEWYHWEFHPKKNIESNLCTEGLVSGDDSSLTDMTRNNKLDRLDSITSYYWVKGLHASQSQKYAIMRASRGLPSV